MIENSSPVIILGMHRSGTTMLTNLIHKYGIFMGSQMEQNSESIGFLKINEQLLKNHGGTWYKPIHLSVDNVNEYEIKYIENLLKKESFKVSYYANEDRNMNEFRWGWKDPRNTFTTEVWKHFFPKAKFIHIYRNPIDVANSLMVRENKFTKNGKIKWYYNVVKNYVKSGLYVERAPELSNIENGIDLWKSYVTEAFLIQDRIIHIKYENLLTNPVEELEKIINFLGISHDKSKILEITSQINSKRKYAFVNNDFLKDVYLNHEEDELITKLGYKGLLDEH